MMVDVDYIICSRVPQAFQGPADAEAGPRGHVLLLMGFSFAMSPKAQSTRTLHTARYLGL